ESGAEGFGYDPLFIPDSYDRTFAEMSADEKNAISHRGRAVAALVEILK
ncbi:MAG: non-canonical purine NTP pyrophosphatase, partial [Alistipes sp.]|nr:non-canonical purine NTP pyrophosphatase [Paludibacteraceae bacterium]MBO5687628.1 non-canonical purine NTP pyrophosphatase [Alistipes sp.]